MAAELRSALARTPSPASVLPRLRKPQDPDVGHLGVTAPGLASLLSA